MINNESVCLSIFPTQTGSFETFNNKMENASQFERSELPKTPTNNEESKFQFEKNIAWSNKESIVNQVSINVLTSEMQEQSNKVVNKNVDDLLNIFKLAYENKENLIYYYCQEIYETFKINVFILIINKLIIDLKDSPTQLKYVATCLSIFESSDLVKYFMTAVVTLANSVYEEVNLAILDLIDEKDKPYLDKELSSFRQRSKIYQ